jgi:hypothetical protein
MGERKKRVSVGERKLVCKSCGEVRVRVRGFEIGSRLGSRLGIGIGIGVRGEG